MNALKTALHNLEGKTILRVLTNNPNRPEIVIETTDHEYVSIVINEDDLDFKLGR